MLPPFRVAPGVGQTWQPPQNHTLTRATYEQVHKLKPTSGHSVFLSAESTRQDFHSLALADFDSDGDRDVFSGGGPLTKDTTHRSFIWENADGRGGKWIEHEILRGKRCHEAKAADVDGDGDVDICTKPWNGSEHIYLRNLLRERRQ